MGKPLTLTDAVGLLEKCCLLTADTLGGVTDRARTGDFRALSPEDLFARLTLEGTLTPFQARQLCAGRWRGLMLRNYRLLARLGSGGTGFVFLGEHIGLGRKVAVKVLTLEAADDPTARARLVREARVASALNHPNIIRVLDIEADANPPYLVMEYVDGISLQAAVSVAGTFRAEAAALVARQVAFGLQHAWENGLVHRDVKPANLLLDRLGQVRILDLGIVRGNFDDELTESRGREIVGTLDYLAPEQARDSSAVDCRADVYGLGATLYFLLAGHPPFADVPPLARLRLKQQAEPEPIHLLRPDVPTALSAVIAAMTARRPEDRPQSPAAVADALAPFAMPVSGFPDDVFASARAARKSVDAGTPTPTRANELQSSVLPGLGDPKIEQAFPEPAPTIRFLTGTTDPTPSELRRLSPPLQQPKRNASRVWFSVGVVALLAILIWLLLR